MSTFVPWKIILIQSCKRGDNWDTFDPKFEKYSFLNKVISRPGTGTELIEDREERAIFTAAIFGIGTLIGALTIGTVLVTGSTKIAQLESDANHEKAVRQLEKDRFIQDFISENNKTIEVAVGVDHLEYINILGARSNNNYFKEMNW